MSAKPWKCSMCRAVIDEGATYYRCSVASCNAGRMKLRFCSQPCWERHIPIARHRNATAVAEVASPGDATA